MSTDHLDQLPLPRARWLDKLCDRFDAAWRAAAPTDPRPLIERYVGEAPEPEHPAVLRELLAIDIEYRRRAGESPRPCDYLERFPAVDRAWLADLCDTSPTPALAPHRAGAAVFLAPERVGKFELLERVGAGSFGVVWRARDTELNRTVALKIGHPGLFDTPEYRERFQREARAAAQLRHPGIVTVYDVTALHGQPVLVCDFIDGLSLRDLLRRQRPAFREAAALVAAVAEALDYAHGMGVVHRDVKPANILLAVSDQRSAVSAARDDHAGGLIAERCLLNALPKIVDFGLALHEGADGTLTQEGQVLGTPAYMSPEQARGEAHRVDGRTDVYSLGVILYELLTGELPFRGSKGLILHQVLHEEPRPLRRRSAPVPRDLETVTLKCLAKEPARRYPTARELADDLRRFLRDEPIQARRAGRAEQLWRWGRRNPVVAGLAAAAAILLIAAAVSTSLWAVSAMQAADREKGLRADAEAAERRAVEQVVTAHVSSGMRLVDEGDLLGALPYLVRALELDQGHPEREEMHRWRLGAVLQQCPKLTQLWPHDGKVLHAEFDATGRRAVTAGEDGTARLWDVDTGQSIATLKHDGAVSQAAFSPDGRRVLTASADGTARVWEGDSGIRQLTLAHGATIHAAAFSPDGGRILTACADKTARLWDAATGQLLHTLSHAHPVYQAVFSPDGRFVLTAARDNPALAALESEVGLWDATTGGRRPLAAVAETTYVDQAVAFSPDGRRVLAIGLRPGGGDSNDARVQCWDVATGRPLQTLSAPGHRAGYLAFSPDGRSLVTGGALGTDRMNRTAQVWDTITGRPVGPPLTHPAGLRFAAWSPDGGRVLTAGADGLARVWEARTGRALSAWLRHAGPVVHAVFHPDGRRLVTASHDGTARLWDLASGVRLTPPFKHQPPWGFVRATFSPDGGRVLTAGFDGSGRVWDATTGVPLTPRLPFEGYVSHAEFSPDGHRFVTTTGSPVFPPADPTWVHAAWVWDAATGALRAGPMRHGQDVVHAAFSPDGRWVATASGRWYARDTDRVGEARVWDAATGAPRTPFLHHDGPVRHVAFSPHGRRIVTASADGTARVWDAATGEHLFTLGHGRAVNQGVFSADGHWIVTAGTDGTAQVWDATTGQRRATFAYGGDVTSAAFRADGRSVLTASADGTARVWDAHTGRPLTRPVKHGSQLTQAVFSPDGRRLATASRDKTARVWDAATGQPVSPALGHDGAVFDAAFHPDGRRLVTACGGLHAQVWELPHEDRPTADLIDLARLLSAHQLDPAGELTPLSPAALTATWRELAPRHSGAFGATPQEVAAWYRGRADACLAEERWSQARWYLDRLLTGSGGEAQDWYERGRAHAEMGHWACAAADFARALEQRPDELEWRVWHAELCLAAGDRAGYCRIGARLLEDFRRTRDPRNVGLVASLCVLAPAAVSDPTEVVALAERRPPHHLLGAALYRAGRFETAAAQLAPYAELPPGLLGGNCRNWLFLAMAQQRLGRPEEARRLLERAADWLDALQRERAASKADKRVNWSTALSLTLLRREAETLILGTPTTPKL